MTQFNYVGTELDLFSKATNWKSYVRSQIGPYLGAEVLEVGAGMGGTTHYYCRGNHERWICLEPDPVLADQLGDSIRRGELPGCCRVVVGTLADVGDLSLFDTLLYIDVMEHIEDDRSEMERAALRLKPGGHLVMLSPAHQWLFTPFDAAIGHFRRYTKRTVRALSLDGLSLVRVAYLDSAGMLASLGNRLVLKSAMPSPHQIAVWDKYLVTASRITDLLLGYGLGKSVLGVWRKQ